MSMRGTGLLALGCCRRTSTRSPLLFFFALPPSCAAIRVPTPAAADAADATGTKFLLERLNRLSIKPILRYGCAGSRGRAR